MWNSDYPELINKTGFSAIPGGFRDYDGVYSEMGNRAFWWSSSSNENNQQNSNGRSIHYDRTADLSIGYPKVSAFSIRCVRD